MKNKNFDRGYLSIGIGSYYRYLAKNLIKSYRLNTLAELPFCIVTEEIDEEIKELADIVVIDSDKLIDAFLYKLRIFSYSPFKETLFIDADCLIFSDTNFLWDFFKNKTIGVIGQDSSNPENLKTFFNYQIVHNETGLSEFPIFNGGIYYFKKCKEAEKVFIDAMNISNFYDKYGMTRIRNMKNEEPLMSVAMAYNKIHACKDVNLNTMYCVPGLKELKINLLKGECSFQKYNTAVNPTIMHFLTSGTKLFHYKREIMRYNLYIHGFPNGLIKLLLLPSNILYSLKVLTYRVIKRKKLGLNNLRPFTLSGY